jgi:hypothetical protein
MVDDHTEYRNIAEVVGDVGPAAALVRREEDLVSVVLVRKWDKIIFTI